MKRQSGLLFLMTLRIVHCVLQKVCLVCWGERADGQLIQPPNHPTQIQNQAFNGLICAQCHQSLQQQRSPQFLISQLIQNHKLSNQPLHVMPEFLIRI